MTTGSTDSTILRELLEYQALPIGKRDEWQAYCGMPYALLGLNPSSPVGWRWWVPRAGRLGLDQYRSRRDLFHIDFGEF